MLRIGEFSKLSHLTIKALRYYEKEGLLEPILVDDLTGYRYYETSQLQDAASIKSYRQLGLTIEEIKSILNGASKKQILKEKLEFLKQQKVEIDIRLSIINHILEDREMNYQVIVKQIEKTIVYYSIIKIDNYSDMMKIIPELGQECMTLNPTLKCANPPYEFCEYLDKEHKESDILICHNEAVESFGKESERIKFKEIPACKVLSIFHKGHYDKIGDAYAFIMKYASENGYEVCGLARECYIDGIWNKDNVEDWLTEIQLPVK